MSSSPDIDPAVAVPEDIDRAAAPGREREDFSRNTFSALRHRNFRLFSGQLISLTGTWIDDHLRRAGSFMEFSGSKALARRRRRGRLRADADLLDLGRLGGDRYAETFRARLRHTSFFHDPFAHHGGARLERTREAMADHRARDIWQSVDGVRHAGSPILRHRNDQPRRFDQRDFTQQLGLQQRANRSPFSRRNSHGQSRHRDVSSARWNQFHCGDCRPPHDAAAEAFACRKVRRERSPSRSKDSVTSGIIRAC